MAANSSRALRMMMMTQNSLRKSRLSAPQLQAQLSRLSDRTRLRRLKDTLRSKGAWQHVVRIEDLCHTHGSHKTRVRAVSSHRTTTSPTYKRDSATGPTRAVVCAPCADHCWTLNSSTVKPAALTKPTGNTMHAFMQSCGG